MSTESLNINIGDITFDSHGRTIITDENTRINLNIILKKTEEIECNTNNGCTTDTNCVANCGSLNGSCEKISDFIHKDDIFVTDSKIIISDLDFNKKVLENKLLGNEDVNFSMHSSNDINR